MFAIGSGEQSDVYDCLVAVTAVDRNFKDDPDCAKHLPVADDGANLYDKCKDGILLWLVFLNYR